MTPFLLMLLQGLGSTLLPALTSYAAAALGKAAAGTNGAGTTTAAAVGAAIGGIITAATGLNPADSAAAGAIAAAGTGQAVATGAYEWLKTRRARPARRR